MIKAIAQRYRRFQAIQREGLKPAFAKKQNAEVECLNCGNHYNGNFCPRCGQTASTKRITLKDTLHNIFASIIAGDDVFFRTCRDLLWRPGYMVNDYLYGKRSSYFRPIQMLVRMVAVFVLLSFVFGQEASVLTLVDEQTMEEHVHSENLAKAITILSSLLSNKVFSSLALAFVCVIPFKLLYRRCTVVRADGKRTTLNVAEHFYALVYVACMNMLFAFFFMLLKWAGVNAMDLISYENLLFIVAPIWLYRQLFDISWLRSIMLGILAMLTTLIGIVLLVLLTFGVFYGIDAI